MTPLDKTRFCIKRWLVTICFLGCMGAGLIALEIFMYITTQLDPVTPLCSSTTHEFYSDLYSNIQYGPVVFDQLLAHQDNQNHRSARGDA